MGLFGVINRLLYLNSRKNSIWKVTAASAVAQIVVSVVLNTLIIWLYYGAPLAVILPTRLIGAAVELPLYAWLLMLLAESLKPLVGRVLEPEKPLKADE